jgi:hypothetical protein
MYKIITTRHANERMRQRGIDYYMACGAILGLGEAQLNEYRDGKCDVLVKDVRNDYSVVFTVKGTRIIIITVISGCHCHAHDAQIECKIL